MWKNGKEGRRIVEEKDGRRETIEAEEKNGAKEKGGCGRRGKGSGRNVVGKTEWEETK